MFRKRDPLHFGVQFKTSESFFCYVLGMMPRFIRGGVDVKRENSRKVIFKKRWDIVRSGLESVAGQHLYSEHEVLDTSDSLRKRPRSSMGLRINRLVF